MPLLVLDHVDHVVRHQVRDNVVGLVDLHVEDTLIIETLALDHLAMVDADGKQ